VIGKKDGSARDAARLHVTHQEIEIRVLGDGAPGEGPEMKRDALDGESLGLGDPSPHRAHADGTFSRAAIEHRR